MLLTTCLNIEIKNRILPTQSINMYLVTGGSGFLGAYVVCTLLQQGHTVKAIKRTSSNLNDFDWVARQFFAESGNKSLEQLTWIEADILDIVALDEAFSGIDTVFHCAAEVSFNGDLIQLFKTNQEGTANVVNACLKQGVKKLAYVSSTAALGRTDQQALIDEDTQWVDDRNNTLYAESKHLAELEVWRGVEEGLNVVIVNPGIILGPGFWHKGSSQLFQKIANGWPFYTQGINGFVGVKDVAKLLLALAQSDTINQRFVLVSENISYKTLFDHMAQGLGVKAPHIHIKASYLPFIKGFMWIYKRLYPKSSIGPETLQTALKKHAYDASKIKALGYGFEPIESVVQEACLLYKAQ